jgi:hypothetical protein
MLRRDLGGWRKERSAGLHRLGAARGLWLFARSSRRPLSRILARRGGGPSVWTMTLNYCRKMVANKGISDVTRFQQEVSKCVANPVTYPPAYK